MGYKEIALKLPTDYTEDRLRGMIEKKLNIKEFSFRVERQSLDARKRSDIYWQVLVSVSSEEVAGAAPVISPPLTIPYRKRTGKVAVVGSGPAGFFCAFALQKAGFNTGLYTSPHYSDFRERIKINGSYISKKEVIRIVKRLGPAIFRIRPSFFELTVAMAFECFATHNIDIAIVETGLGGRLDSTNVLSPKLSLITNISYDHMNFLGETLEEIAVEKAGIIKQLKSNKLLLFAVLCI